MIVSWTTTNTNDNIAHIRQSRQQSSNSMKPSTPTGSAIVPDQRACVRRIDATTHSSTGADANNVEMSLTQLNILWSIELLITSKRQNYWIRMNQTSGKLNSHLNRPA
jgi:hypothetical protein